MNGLLIPTAYQFERTTKCHECKRHASPMQVCVKVVCKEKLSISPAFLCKICCPEMLGGICSFETKTTFFVQLKQVYENLPESEIDATTKIRAGLVNYLLKFKPKELVFFGRERAV